jgi:hypothetical protein
MVRNTNCLHDIQCPACGNESRFKIVALVTADVRDDGAEFHGDAEWTDESPISCPECERSGKLGEFRCRTYNVHIYREMRLRFDAIRASSAEAAAKLADGMPTSAACGVEDCDGESLSALVDVVGDDEFAKTQNIDFESGRKLKVHQHLLDALLDIKRLAEKSGDYEADPFALLDLIADEARAAINLAKQE